ncbi:MAG TPA: arabinan endo-1,5-alpha-L-arabinosidase [Polyangiaceae bacterium]|nr:arabinan endo-1,5-alpha-L-arabinosidase [Polyangiaceae bacterium]
MRSTVLWIAITLGSSSCAERTPGAADSQPRQGCTGAGCGPERGASPLRDEGESDPSGTAPMNTEEVVTPGGLIGSGNSSSGTAAPADGRENSAASDAGAAGNAPDSGGPALDRCDVGVFDPDRPPQALALSGNLGAHDPVIIAADGQYHYFSTGNGISVKTSTDLLRWTQQPDVFPTTPAWFEELVPAYAPRNIWAPDISYFGGQYHLYYSVSSFGSNRSCIGHATRPSLTQGSWTDHENAFCSNQPGQNDNYNAIDPNVVLDETGSPWLAFGSFWSGVKMIRLDLNGDRTGTELIDLASRGGGAIEAPFLVRRCGYYYLFVSFDACCQGANSTYNTRVGRARELLGPYLARDGTPMLEGGGSLLLQAGGDWVGPGHNAILIVGTRAYNVYHAYAAGNGASQLRISELVWDGDGWPISGGP